ncbi:MAG: hypothetical protein AAGI91_00840 [Bacteroidota bacterium]
MAKKNVRGKRKRPSGDASTPKPEHGKARAAKVRASGTVLHRTAWDRLSPWVRHAVCLAFLLAVTLGFFASTTFGGQTLVGGDIVKWRGMAESVIEHREETGQDALWATNAFAGMPSFMVSYPIQVLQADNVLGVLRKLGWWPGAHFFALLAGMYLLIVYLFRNTLAATLGAVAFGLTTYIPIILVAGHTSKFIALALAPWLVLAYAFVVRRPPDATWMQTLLGSLLFAIVLAVNLRAGHIQITYYVAFAIGIAWIVGGVAAFREGAGRGFVTSTGALALGSILALLMVAHPYLIQAEYKAFTIRAAGESGGLAYDYAMRWSQGWGELATLLIPNAYGGGGQTYWGAKTFTVGPHYVGAVVVMLAGMGLWGVRRRIVWAAGIAAGLMVLFSLGENFPLLNRPMFDFFPLFNAFRVPETWLIVVVLLLAFLAGAGVHYLARREATPESEARKTKAVYVALGSASVLLAVLWLGGGALFSFEKPGERAQIEQMAQQQNIAPGDPRVQQVLREVREERRDLFASDALRSVLFLLLAAVLLILHRRRTVPAWALQVGLILLVTVDLWQVGQRYYNAESPSLKARSDIEAQIPEYGFDRFIKARIDVAGGPGNFRTLPLALNPFIDGRTPYHYESVGGYHGAKLALFQDYMDHLLVNPDGSLNENGLDLLSTRYVVARQPVPGLGVAFRDEQTGLVVLENPDVLPRAFFVEETEVVEGPEATFERLRDPSLDLRRTALLAEPLPEALAPVPIDSASTASVELSRFGPREIVWQVETDRPRLFVASEVYYPAGWYATLDDARVPIIRANHLLRGVVVPAGKHILTMQFDPPRHELGLLISQLATALVYLAALLMAGLLWYRRGEKE